jgi:hypothetical protein
MLGAAQLGSTPHPSSRLKPHEVSLQDTIYGECRTRGSTPDFFEPSLQDEEASLPRSRACECVGWVDEPSPMHEL